MAPSKKLTDEYEIIQRISGGTCGDVLKAREIKTGKLVAAKRIKFLNPSIGFPPNSLLEIDILRHVKHTNLANLIQVCIEDHHVYLIFDYLEYDLYGLMYSNNLKLNVLQVRCFSRQLMLGLQALHSNNVLHRDLKPANLLISHDNLLQITDFGLAMRETSKVHPPTREVITIWYRPPELLLGVDDYGSEIDIWSAGCIIYEMITRNVLFRGAMDSEIEELSTIFSICGLPNEQWPEWRVLPNAQAFLHPHDHRYTGKSLEEYLNKTIPEDFKLAIPLLLDLLRFNPKQRIDVNKALQHPFLCSENDELEPSKLPKLTFPDSHQSILEKNDKITHLPKPKRPPLPPMPF